MAINNRLGNQLTIDTNLPDNTTEAITPALHREVETDLNDSCFNKIDEPRKYVLEFNVNSRSTTSLLYSENEPIIIDTTSEVISQTLVSAQYQVSIDGENWLEPSGGLTSTIVDLSNWISANIVSGITFSIRAIGIYDVGKTSEASIKFNFKYFN